MCPQLKITIAFIKHYVWKIFDGLIDHNIKVRKDLIAESKNCLYKVARDIEQIAVEQLNVLSKAKNYLN